MLGFFVFQKLVNWLPPFTRKLNPREFILLGFFICNNQGCSHLIIKQKPRGFSPEVSGPPRVQNLDFTVRVFCFSKTCELASTFHEKVKPQGIYSFGVFRFFYYIGAMDDFNK
jgi:hypothetical protein